MEFRRVLFRACQVARHVPAEVERTLGDIDSGAGQRTKNRERTNDDCCHSRKMAPCIAASWPWRGIHDLILSSEERRVGKECVSPFRYRWSLYHLHKNTDTLLIRVK